KADDAKEYEKVVKKHHYGYFEINGDVLRTKILDIHSQEFDTFTLDKTPVANFEVNQTDGICQFKSLSTGNIKELEWQFLSNGTSSSEQDIDKSCEDVAPGVIRLTAKSIFHSNTATILTNSPKILNVSFSANITTGPIGTVVRFTPVDPVDWEKDTWRVGGSVGSGGDLFDNINHEGFNYTFTTNGKFRVAREVKDNAGHKTHIAIEEFICIEPYSRFTFLPQDGKVNEEISFYNESVGDGLTYEWDFGDGVRTSTDPHPTHTYLDAGTYTVELHITDKDGLTDSYLRKITIVE
ncbi:MAG: PKD domain-containing protein, partial [Campylobacterota bacterium]|nr:PKD domain-containing protein [Campylobacterota bacterium]